MLWSDMHVFIDTNIFLNFYHFTNDDLDALNSVFVSNDQGAITLHLTDQVRDEFWRNRETKIKDALKQFRSLNLSAQFPYFMKVYPEYSELQELNNALKSKFSDISKKSAKDIKENNLQADHLIGGIFSNSSVIITNKRTYNRAKMRMDIGNPPGKNSSIGDAINWLLLLSNVPNGEDLYVISEDSDFYSSIDESEVNPFLLNEWETLKDSKIKGYRNLKDFMKDHYDGITLSFDPEKKELIDMLETSCNFASTHTLISRLNGYGYFSLEEAKTILDAAVANSQFGDIIRDRDVLDFIKMAILPHENNLTKKNHKDIIKEMLKHEGNA